KLSWQPEFCWEYALVLCACYASMYFGGRWIMKDRKPFKLRMYTPHYGNGPVGLWVALLNFSNVLEFFDMLFIVLRKQPLPFMVWYYRTAALFFFWYAFATPTASGLYFVAINSMVRAIWNFDGVLTLMGFRPRWENALVISWLSQFVAGMAVCLLATYYIHSGVACAADREWWIFVYLVPFFFILKDVVVPHVLSAKKKTLAAAWLSPLRIVTRLPAPELDPPLCTEMSAPDTEEPPLASPTPRQFWKTLECENLSRCANKCDAEKHSEKASFCVLPAWHKPELQPAQQDGSRTSTDTTLDTLASPLDDDEVDAMVAKEQETQVKLEGFWIQDAATHGHERLYKSAVDALHGVSVMDWFKLRFAKLDAVYNSLLEAFAVLLNFTDNAYLGGAPYTPTREDVMRLLSSSREN
ncbi:hypothetical protein PybrP1_007530, partial [[Pythium] brassicae (nom. inval.)]